MKQHPQNTQTWSWIALGRLGLVVTGVISHIYLNTRATDRLGQVVTCSIFYVLNCIHFVKNPIICCLTASSHAPLLNRVYLITWTIMLEMCNSFFKVKTLRQKLGIFFSKTYSYLLSLLSTHLTVFIEVRLYDLIWINQPDCIWLHL